MLLSINELNSLKKTKVCWELIAIYTISFRQFKFHFKKK